jgi:hypothetical protein
MPVFEPMPFCDLRNPVKISSAHRDINVFSHPRPARIALRYLQIDSQAAHNTINKPGPAHRSVQPRGSIKELFHVIMVGLSGNHSHPIFAWPRVSVVGLPDRP